VATPLAPANGDSATGHQVFESRAPVRATDVGAAAPRAPLDGRGRAASASVLPARAAWRALRRRKRFGSELPGEHIQKAHFRDYHLDGWRPIRRCGEALGCQPGSGRAKSSGTGVSSTLLLGNQRTALWRRAASEHLVQKGAESGHIGARIGAPYEAARGKQGGTSGAQHNGSRGYSAVRLTCPV